MAPSQLIIDFNRCFEPNAFNTGPRIPPKQTLPMTPPLHASYPLLDIYRGDTPDLTSSPASDVSSVLPLESEEIKRIFSFPAYDRPDVDVVDPPQRFSLFEQIGLARSAEYYQNHAAFLRLGSELYQAHVADTSKEKLNPHAQEFIPTFSKPLRKRTQPVAEPQPLDSPLVGFQAIPLPENVPPPPGLPHPPAYKHTLPARQSTVEPEPLDIRLRGFQGVPLPEDVPPPPGLPHPPAYKHTLPHRQPTVEPEPLDIPLRGFQGVPLPEDVPPPPGLPHPPAFQNAHSSPHPDSVQLPPCIGPDYFPLLLHASLETTTSQERADLMCTLVRGREHWSMDCLLELARHISIGALFPGDLFDKRGVEPPACPPSRYVPEQSQSMYPNVVESDERMKSENILADIANDLYTNFKEWPGRDCAEAFRFKVRELVVVQFKQSWDSTNPLAVNFESGTTPLYVRSCLALCKSVGALFNHKLFTHRDIDACVKVLLQGLISVEYAEALVTLVLACGPRYLNPDAERPLGEYQRVATLVESIQTYLDPITARISDDTSVVCQPWGEGQLHARLSLLIEFLGSWEEGWACVPKSASFKTVPPRPQSQVPQAIPPKTSSRIEVDMSDLQLVQA